ncbi:FAD-dependent oxidoreductase [Nonomuraea fuscirosea]|uniref:FAD-dependent oxidoreductase n=1 Tax=Nonomuraea fuscirosea TaxID=1291556 RepID=UPI0033E986F9
MHHTGPFDRTVDVVVLGLGDAGAVAAVTAHDAGAEVLVVEKQQAAGHRPNSRYAAGFFLVPEDVEGAVAYLSAMYAVNGELSTVDPALIRAWAEETAANPAWLDRHGGTYVKMNIHGEHPSLPGHESIRVYKAQPSGSPEGYTGCPMHGFLRGLIAERAIEVRYGTAARWLLTDAASAVVGVETECDGQVRRIGVRRGVVLAVGGYESSERLKRQYLPISPAHFYGTEHNTGDGITMAIEAGAELWHMNVWPGHFVARFPGGGYTGGTGIDLWGSGRFGPPDDVRAPGSIFVDGTARRFIREPGRQHAANLELLAMDADSLTYPRIPTWWIFDQERFERATLVPTYSGPAGPVGDYTWSEDNVAELREGWIQSAGSVKELAVVCGLDPAALERTVARYNEHCANGVDADFGRDPVTLTPLGGDRYYAVPLWPGGSHTVGGPRRDANARVASIRGGSISHLYSAGELGSLHGLLYPTGGGSIAECLAFGRIAGRNAAADRVGGS